MGFAIDELVPKSDLTNESKMAATRRLIDGGAKGHSSSARFAREETLPYVHQVHKDGAIVDLPETAETKKWVILRRYYE